MTADTDRLWSLKPRQRFSSFWKRLHQDCLVVQGVERSGNLCCKTLRGWKGRWRVGGGGWWPLMSFTADGALVLHGQFYIQCLKLWTLLCDSFLRCCHHGGEEVIGTLKTEGEMPFPQLCSSSRGRDGVWGGGGVQVEGTL